MKDHLTAELAEKAGVTKEEAAQVLREALSDEQLVAVMGGADSATSSASPVR